MGRGARGKETVTWQDSQKVEELNGLIAIAYSVCVSIYIKDILLKTQECRHCLY